MTAARQHIRNIIIAAALIAAAAFPARAEMEPQKVAKLRTLDKITARTMTFEADVGSTVKFGPLFIKVRACHKTPPMETPESAAFLQIWENSLREKKPQWVFSGWMFASSPALSAMDHAVYDVWVLDCLAYKTGQEPPPEPETPPVEDAVAPATQTDAPAAAEEIVEEEAPPSPDDESAPAPDDTPIPAEEAPP